MLLLQLDAVTTAVDVAAIATSVVGFVAGFLAVLLLGKYVVIPG
ncbi:mechanosensitive ion channel family protein, partial [Halorubrum sp. SD626R]